MIQTIYDKYPFPDCAMVALAMRALSGDERHQYTMQCLKERNEETYNRIMDWAKEELSYEEVKE